MNNNCYYYTGSNRSPWRKWTQWCKGRQGKYFCYHVVANLLVTHGYACLYLLLATRGTSNPNLQCVITHASYVCSQHSFGLPIRMNGMYINAISSCTFGPSIPRNLITCVLTICHAKLTRSTALEQKRFDLQSLSPALRYLWLLLVLVIISKNLQLIIRYNNAKIYAELNSQYFWHNTPEANDSEGLTIISILSSKNVAKSKICYL